MSQPQPWACNQGKGLQESGPRERPGSVGECENEHSHSQMNFHCVWELESQWTPKTSKNNCKGQNPSPCGNLYIIGNLFKRRCPKWDCMTHLDICNIIMAKRKVGNQSDNLTPDHGKSRINPIPLCAGGMRHAIEKLLTRATTLVQTPSQSEVCTRNYRPAKLRDSQPQRFWDSWDKKSFRCHSRGEVQNILYGGRWWLPPSLGRGEFCESEVARGLSQHQRCSHLVLTNLFVGFVQVDVNE